MNYEKINRAASYVFSDLSARTALDATLGFPSFDELSEALNAAAELNVDPYDFEWTPLYYNRDCADFFVRFPGEVNEALEYYGLSDVCHAVNMDRSNRLSNLLSRVVEALEDVEVPDDFE